MNINQSRTVEDRFYHSVTLRAELLLKCAKNNSARQRDARRRSAIPLRATRAASSIGVLVNNALLGLQRNT
jgi:hypothetical protein